VGVEGNYFSNLRILKETRVHRESFKYIENRLNYLRERETTIRVRVYPKS
jgi:RIO-like serine/threonine protein kinase